LGWKRPCSDPDPAGQKCFISSKICPRPEDAQWIDPTSLELFSRIVDRIPTLRVLLIMTYRPEFQPPWLGRPYVTALTINRLTEREAGAMIDRIVGNQPLQASICRDIIERSDGNRCRRAFVETLSSARTASHSSSRR
jgi:hypothetical protein